MPRLIDQLERRSDMVAAVTRIVAEAGTAAVTLRRVADELGMSHPGLVHHVGGRDRLLGICAVDHGGAMVDRILERPASGRLLAFLPVDCLPEPGHETTDPAWDTYPFATFRPFGVAQMRVWLSWCTLAHTHEPVAGAVESVRQRQLTVLAGALTRSPAAPLDATRLDATLGVIDGLRAATCRRIDPMSLLDARKALLHVVDSCL